MLRLLILLLFCSCSGYRFSQQENPLSQYGIQSLSVPMFYNYSNMPELHTDFTRETYRLLTTFSGLKLVPGYSQNSDAVLIGILKSPEKLNETLRASNLRLAQERVPMELGTLRQGFYIPGSSDVTLFLHVIVIKKPSEEELALLRSGIGEKLGSTSKIIFNELIPLRTQFTHEVLDNAGVEVVGTQNLGVQRRALGNLAQEAALTVRDMILYAF